MIFYQLHCISTIGYQGDVSCQALWQAKCLVEESWTVCINQIARHTETKKLTMECTTLEDMREVFVIDTVTRLMHKQLWHHVKDYAPVTEAAVGKLVDNFVLSRGWNLDHADDRNKKQLGEIQSGREYFRHQRDSDGTKPPEKNTPERKTEDHGRQPKFDPDKGGALITTNGVIMQLTAPRSEKARGHRDWSTSTSQYRTAYT